MIHDDFKLIVKGKELQNPVMRMVAIWLLMYIAGFIGGYLLK